MAKWPMVGADGTTRSDGAQVFQSFGGDIQSGTEANTQQEVRDTYTAGNLRLFISSFSGANMVATFRTNGADDTQTVTVTGTGEFEDTVNTDSLVSGDLIDLDSDQSAAGMHGDEFTLETFQTTLDASSNVPLLLGAGGGGGLGGEWEADNNFAALQGGLAEQAAEADVEYTMRATRTLRDLRVFATSHTGGSDSVITVRKNQADTSLTVTVTGSGEFLDTSNTASFVAGDESNYGASDVAAGSLLSVRGVEADTSSSVVMGTNTSVGTSTEFFIPSGTATTTTEVEAQVEAEAAVTIQNLFVNCFTNAETRTIRSRKNAANGNLSVSVTGTGLFEDTSNSDSLVAEDDLSIQQDSGSAGTNGYLVAVEWETAAAGLEILAAPVVMTMAVPTPTVDPVSVSIAPAPVTMPVVIPTPTVVFGAQFINAASLAMPLVIPTAVLSPVSVSILAAPVVMTIAPVTPVVSGAGTVTITVAPVAMTLVVPTPTVDPQAVALAIAALALTLGVVDPTLVVGGQAVLAAAAVVLTLAVPTPVVVAQGAVTLVIAPVGMPLVVVDPTVDPQSVSIAPAPVVMVLGIPTPTLVAGALSLAPAALPMVLSVVGPTLDPVSVSLALAALSMGIAVVDPALTGAGTATITAAALAMVLGVQDPTLDPQSVSISPAALALVLGVVDPIVTGVGSVAMLVGSVVITLAIPTPTMDPISVAIVAAPVVLTLVIPTPTVTASVIMLIAPVVMTLTIPTPRVLLGPERIVYRPFMRWPPVNTVAPHEIMRGEQPQLVRQPDGSYIRVNPPR